MAASNVYTPVNASPASVAVRSALNTINASAKTGALRRSGDVRRRPSLYACKACQTTRSSSKRTFGSLNSRSRTATRSAFASRYLRPQRVHTVSRENDIRDQHGLARLEEAVRARRLGLVVVQHIPQQDVGVGGDQGCGSSRALSRDSSSVTPLSPVTWARYPLAAPAVFRTMVMRPSATKLRTSSPGPIPTSSALIDRERDLAFGAHSRHGIPPPTGSIAGHDIAFFTNVPPVRNLPGRAVARPLAWAVHEVLVERFTASFARPPEEIVLDIDATDDPLHGRQEGRFFHGLL